MEFAKLTTYQKDPLPEQPDYPRPQLERDSYLKLDGWWDFTVSQGEALPRVYERKIRVPFCPESRLSGIEQHFPEGSNLFYRRRFQQTREDRRRVVLHVGAADQMAWVYVNGKCVGSHVGGYEAFSMDITDAVTDEDNELVIRVVDDLRSTVLPRGKQTTRRGGMWYTPVSGIWQTVWLECVPDKAVEKLDIKTTLTAAEIQITPPLDGKITLENGQEFPVEQGKAVVAPEDPQLWTPETPRLYHFTLQAGEDRVRSYFALRTLEIRSISGLPRLCLNGKPYFFHGLLDQGYWPDGLFTPPSPGCYAQDILLAKSLGFNTLRKHIKVEPERYYYECDRLGMAVFQDMVSNGDYSYLRDTVLPTAGMQVLPDRWMHRDRETRQAFLDGMEATVAQLKNHPCVVYWTIFNEGWGQFDASAAYDRLKELDGSRFTAAVSGWFRGGRSDVDSHHIYFGPWNLKASRRPLVLTEFGGYTCAVEGHIFNLEKSYGYRTCTSLEAYQEDLLELYRRRILPEVRRGLCAAIYTQLSDIEDEINGVVTYDRRVVKLSVEPMQTLSRELARQMEQGGAAPETSAGPSRPR